MGTKVIYVEVSEGDHERLSRIKEEHGLTWRGMLIQAADALEDGE